MTCSQHRDAIQELVDGTLTPLRKAQLQAHLDQCDSCRSLVADLQRVHDLAQDLERLSPPDRVWLQVAGRLRQEGRIQPPVVSALQRRRHYAVAAIAATLVIGVGSALIAVLPTLRNREAAPQGNVTGSNTVQSLVEELRLADQHYQNVIAKLEEIAKTEQDVIEPETAALLRKNLQVIDQAIVESRAALTSEPQSEPARESLFQALKRKVDLLQDTIVLMNEMRKGNAAGAAQMIDGGNKS